VAAFLVAKSGVKFQEIPPYFLSEQRTTEIVPTLVTFLTLALLLKVVWIGLMFLYFCEDFAKNCFRFSRKKLTKIYENNEIYREN
jgi:hypothetical protein